MECLYIMPDLVLNWKTRRSNPVNGVLESKKKSNYFFAFFAKNFVHKFAFPPLLSSLQFVKISFILRTLTVIQTQIWSPYLQLKRRTIGTPGSEP